MTAKNIFDIAIHLSDSEIRLLYDMLSKKIVKQKNASPLKRKLISDNEAIDYLVKNIFQKAII
jgi:hypothetical protein